MNVLVKTLFITKFHKQAHCVALGVSLLWSLCEYEDSSSQSRPSSSSKWLPSVQRKFWVKQAGSSSHTTFDIKSKVPKIFTIWFHISHEHSYGWCVLTQELLSSPSTPSWGLNPTRVQCRGNLHCKTCRQSSFELFGGDLTLCNMYSYCIHKQEQEKQPWCCAGPQMLSRELSSTFRPQFSSPDVFSTELVLWD